MTWVTVVASHHSTPSAANVAAPTASRPTPRLPPPTESAPSVRALGEGLELRISLDHLHELVGHVRRGILHALDGADALQEFRDLRHPLVHLRGPLRAVHDLQVLLQVV